MEVSTAVSLNPNGACEIITKKGRNYCKYTATVLLHRNIRLKYSNHKTKTKDEKLKCNVEKFNINACYIES